LAVTRLARSNGSLCNGSSSALEINECNDAATAVSCASLLFFRGPGRYRVAREIAMKKKKKQKKKKKRKKQKEKKKSKQTNKGERERERERDGAPGRSVGRADELSNGRKIAAIKAENTSSDRHSPATPANYA